MYTQGALETLQCLEPSVKLGNLRGVMIRASSSRDRFEFHAGQWRPHAAAAAATAFMPGVRRTCPCACSWACNVAYAIGLHAVMHQSCGIVQAPQHAGNGLSPCVPGSYCSLKAMQTTQSPATCTWTWSSVCACPACRGCIPAPPPWPAALCPGRLHHPPLPSCPQPQEDRHHGPAGMWQHDPLTSHLPLPAPCAVSMCLHSMQCIPASCAAMSGCGKRWEWLAGQACMHGCCFV